MLIAASSSSAWRTTPPNGGRYRWRYSITSVAGVIGYPAKNRPPPTTNPSATAWLPVVRIMLWASPLTTE